MKKVLWITGNSGAGKSMLAEWIIKHMASADAVWLDGDEMRRVWTDLGFSMEDRTVQNIRVAELARILVEQDKQVVVSTICPTRKIRDRVRLFLDGNVQFIYLSGGRPSSEEYPYQPRQNGE